MVYGIQKETFNLQGVPKKMWFKRIFEFLTMGRDTVLQSRTVRFCRLGRVSADVGTQDPQVMHLFRPACFS